MQSQPIAPHHGHEVDPHSAGEEKHHDEKQTVMSKVKDKVNKIKNKMGKKKEDDGMNRASDTTSDEEMEVEEDGYKEDDDPKISSAPTSEPQRVSIGDAEKFEPEKVRLGDTIGDVKEVPAAPKSTNPPARASEPQRVSIGDDEKFETEKMQLGDAIGAVKDHPAAPKSTNPPARASEPQRVSIGDAEKFEAEKMQLGDAIGDVKQDPAAPKSTNPPARASPQRFSIGDAEKSEAEKVRLGDAIGDVKEDAAAPKSTKPPARGGEDIGMTPVIQSFEAISVSNEPKPELEPKPEAQPSAPIGSTDQPTVTYTEYGKNIASTVYGTLSNAGTAVVQKIRGAPPTKEVDTETNRDVSQDKGVSGKGYNISEKLKPGEEDQNLSEKISEAVQRSKEKTMSSGVAAQTMAGGTQMVEKIRGAVTSVVGGGDKSPSTTVASDLHQEKGSNEEKTMASGATAQTKPGGTGMVEKIRGSVTSVVGGGDKSPSTTVASDLHQEKGSNEEKTMASGATAQTKAGGTGMVEKIRGAVTSVVGGGDKSPSTTVASDLHKEKGSNEAAEPRMQE